MKILIFNWRDIKNPLAGGAERLIHELAKRWVSKGHSVTLFSSAFLEYKKKEIIDGVRIIRVGNRLTVYYQAFRYYRKYFQGQYDLIIDGINTIPFFTPLYVKEPLLAHINQLAREIWFHEIPFPFSLLGFLIEPWYLKIYRKKPITTISQSSREDLLNLGFPRANIYIIPMGMTLKARKRKKKKKPTLIWVNRVIKSKRPEHVLRAFEQVKRRVPDAKLWMVGPISRSYQDRLQNIVQESRLKDVSFYNFVEEKKKQELLQKAHLIISTSVREGWGLTITEANALGTPAVVYNVAGLRDSTKNNKTGLICKKNTPQVLAKNIIRLLQDESLYQRLQEGAYRWGKKFNWDKSAQEALKIVAEVSKTKKPLTAYPKVSIIIPVKGWDKALEECIQKCRTLDYPDYEILILPDTPLSLSSTQVRIIPTGAVRPPTKRDWGAREARGKILAFLDSDAYPSKDWLKSAVRYFQDRELAALGGPAVTPSTDNLRQKASGLIYSSFLGSGMFSYRYWPGRERTVNDYPSCNFLIRKSIMEKVGGFGSQFWPGEDTLLTLKITEKLKKKINYVPDVLVYHHRRPLFKRHLLQVWNYALHRGYFVKRFPQTSRKLFYFLPSLFLLFLLFGGISTFLCSPWRIIYFPLIALYFFSSLITGLKSKNPKLVWLIFLGIPTTHLTYGIAFIKGLFSKELER